HARAALMVRARGTRSRWGAPHMRRAHRAAQLFQLAQQELDTRHFVRAAPVVGQARRRQSERTAYVRMEIDRLDGVRQVFRLRDERGMPCEVFREEVPIRRAPSW